MRDRTFTAMLGIAVILLLVMIGVFLFYKPVVHIESMEGYNPNEIAPKLAKAVIESDQQPSISTDESDVDSVLREDLDESLPFFDETETIQEEVISEAVDESDSEYLASLNPPQAPERGLVNLIDSLSDDTTYEEYEQRLTDYTLTYYPLTMLEADEISQLSSRVQEAYNRQKKAFHQEFIAMFREDFASASPEDLAIIPGDMTELFEKEGVLP